MEQSIRLWLQTTPSVVNSCVTCQWSLAGRALFLTFSAAVAGSVPAGRAARPCGSAPALPSSCACQCPSGPGESTGVSQVCAAWALPAPSPSSWCSQGMIPPSFQLLRLMGWAREAAGSVGEGKSLNLENTDVHHCMSSVATQMEHFHLNYKPSVSAAYPACSCL